MDAEGLVGIAVAVIVREAAGGSHGVAGQGHGLIIHIRDSIGVVDDAADFSIELGHSVAESAAVHCAAGDIQELVEEVCGQRVGQHNHVQGLAAVVVHGDVEHNFLAGYEIRTVGRRIDDLLGEAHLIGGRITGLEDALIPGRGHHRVGGRLGLCAFRLGGPSRGGGVDDLAGSHIRSGNDVLELAHEELAGLQPAGKGHGTGIGHGVVQGDVVDVLLGVVAEGEAVLDGLALGEELAVCRSVGHGLDVVDRGRAVAHAAGYEHIGGTAADEALRQGGVAVEGIGMTVAVDAAGLGVAFVDQLVVGNLDGLARGDLAGRRDHSLRGGVAHLQVCQRDAAGVGDGDQIVDHLARGEERTVGRGVGVGHVNGQSGSGLAVGIIRIGQLAGAAGRSDKGGGDVFQIGAILHGRKQFCHGIDRAACDVGLRHGDGQRVGTGCAGSHGPACVFRKPAADLIDLAAKHRFDTVEDGYGEGIQGFAGTVGPGFGEDNFLADDEMGTVGRRAAQHKGELQANCAQRFLQRRDLAILMGAAAVDAGATLGAGNADLRLLNHTPFAENMVSLGHVLPHRSAATLTGVVMASLLHTGGLYGRYPFTPLMFAALHIIFITHVAALAVADAQAFLIAGGFDFPLPLAPIMALGRDFTGTASFTADGAIRNFLAGCFTAGRLNSRIATPLVVAAHFALVEHLAANGT